MAGMSHKNRVACCLNGVARECLIEIIEIMVFSVSSLEKGDGHVLSWEKIFSLGRGYGRWQRCAGEIEPPDIVTDINSCGFLG